MPLAMERDGIVIGDRVVRVGRGVGDCGFGRGRGNGRAQLGRHDERLLVVRKESSHITISVRVGKAWPAK